MGKKPKTEVRIIRINFVFGKPNAKQIEKNMSKMLTDGWAMTDQRDEKQGCLRGMTTRLTFTRTQS